MDRCWGSSVVALGGQRDNAVLCWLGRSEFGTSVLPVPVHDVPAGAFGKVERAAGVEEQLLPCLCEDCQLGCHGFQREVAFVGEAERGIVHEGINESGVLD